MLLLLVDKSSAAASHACFLPATGHARCSRMVGGCSQLPRRGAVLKGHWALGSQGYISCLHCFSEYQQTHGWQHFMCTDTWWVVDNE